MDDPLLGATAAVDQLFDVADGLVGLGVEAGVVGGVLQLLIGARRLSEPVAELAEEPWPLQIAAESRASLRVHLGARMRRKAGAEFAQVVVHVGHLALTDHAFEDIEAVLGIRGSNIGRETPVSLEPNEAAVGKGLGALEARNHVAPNVVGLFAVACRAGLDGLRAVDSTHGVPSGKGRACSSRPSDHNLNMDES